MDSGDLLVVLVVGVVAAMWGSYVSGRGDQAARESFEDCYEHYCKLCEHDGESPMSFEEYRRRYW